MAVRQFKQKFQTPDNRQYLLSALQSKSPINVLMPSPIDLSDNRRNHIIEVLTKSVKTKNVDKTDTNEEKSGKRNPKCARCANHKPEPVPVKGHKRKCEYRTCDCKLCQLTVEKQILMAKTIREKRKLKEDLEDGSIRYNPPVIKKQRSDDCLSETDKESDYSTNTEDNLKSKPINFEKSFEYIWDIFEQMYPDMSPEDIGKYVLKFINNKVRQMVEPKKTIDFKRKVSKQESTDQTSSVKSEDLNDLHIFSTLTPRKTPISSPTTSSTLPINYPLIGQTPYQLYPYLMPHYNLMNNLNPQSFRYTTYGSKEILSQ